MMTVVGISESRSAQKSDAKYVDMSQGAVINYGVNSVLCNM